MPPETKMCRCGHDRRHTMVSPDPDYSVFDYVRLMIGGTPTPRRVRYQCRTCSQVFDETTDPKELGKHL